MMMMMMMMMMMVMMVMKYVSIGVAQKPLTLEAAC
jgi:hypothetical protein